MNLKLKLLNVISPIFTLVGKIHAPYSLRTIKAKNYYKLKGCLEPGDILLRTRYGELSNLLIPGKYKHAAIVYSQYTVIEAVYPKVKETDLIDFCMSSDLITVLRPKFCVPYARKLAANWAMKRVGTPYDLIFTLRDRGWKLYCYELVSLAYINTVENCPWTPQKRLGEPSFIGDDFIKSSKWDKILTIGE